MKRKVSQLPFGEVTSKQQHRLPSLLIDFVYLNRVLTTRTVNQFLRFYSLLRTERVVTAFGKEAAITSEASPDLAILKLYPCDLMPLESVFVIYCRFFQRQNNQLPIFGESQPLSSRVEG